MRQHRQLYSPIARDIVIFGKAKLYCLSGSLRGEYNITKPIGFYITLLKAKYHCERMLTI